jgi:DNA-binding NtrC family response regulator
MSAARAQLVMVVDDEADICVAIKNYLHNDKIKVSTFTNPALALEHFKISPDDFDVIVTGIKMPGLSGFDLAKKIKSLSPKTKVVLMTAFEDYESKVERLLPGMPIDGFLRKPVSMAKLKQVLASLQVRAGMEVLDHE